MEPRITTTIPDGVTEEDITRAIMVHAGIYQQFVEAITGSIREKQEEPMEPRPETRSVQAEDLNIARRVADYYLSLHGMGVHEPALSACTVAFQQAITRTHGDCVRLVIGEEDSTT